MNLAAEGRLSGATAGSTSGGMCVEEADDPWGRHWRAPALVFAMTGPMRGLRAAQPHNRSRARLCAAIAVGLMSAWALPASAGAATLSVSSTTPSPRVDDLVAVTVSGSTE